MHITRQIEIKQLTRLKRAFKISATISASKKSEAQTEFTHTHTHRGLQLIHLQRLGNPNKE